MNRLSVNQPSDLTLSVFDTSAYVRPVRVYWVAEDESIPFALLPKPPLKFGIITCEYCGRKLPAVQGTQLSMWTCQGCGATL